MPGTPIIIHSTAFLKSDPSGNHCRKRKYVADIVKIMGNLNRNRHIYTGRYIPVGLEGTGRNGAIPVAIALY